MSPRAEHSCWCQLAPASETGLNTYRPQTITGSVSERVLGLGTILSPRRPAAPASRQTGCKFISVAECRVVTYWRRKRWRSAGGARRAARRPQLSLLSQLKHGQNFTTHDTTIPQGRTYDICERRVTVREMKQLREANYRLPALHVVNYHRQNK